MRVAVRCSGRGSFDMSSIETAVRWFASNSVPPPSETEGFLALGTSCPPNIQTSLKHQGAEIQSALGKLECLLHNISRSPFEPSM